MDNKSFIYNKSFEVSLILCDICKEYHNINEVHKCSNIQHQNVDAIEQMKINMQPKVNPSKRKQK